MPQQRFMRRGVTKFFFLKAIAAPTNIPTRSELGAGNATDLSPFVSDVEGWALENTPIETPDMASAFASSIPGEDKAGTSSFTFYEDQMGDVIEQLLSKGVTGFIVVLRKGDVPASRSLDSFPIRVGSRAATYSTGAEPAKFKVGFSITAPPVLDAAVPALT
ncbi:hypothetical protein ACFWXK_14210 [Streptomyces sp. NPDC059070]|uniref:phage tail tube protein n=1 Tax=Streptomyces sp. NPDC059070 TaxID=3346713 RepID=UPI0036CC616E